MHAHAALWAKEALCPQPGTSQRHPGHKVYPYLLRKLTLTRANQVWALDTTYCPMARGFVYLTAVVDVASRKVLAHKVAITLEACHAVEVLEQAFARYGTPELVNTDQGSQFTAEDFTEAVLKRGCKRLMDGRGAWRERAACPRGITCSSNGCGTVSNTNACISRPMTASVPPGPTSGANIDWFNTQRPHSSLQDLTPQQAYWSTLPNLQEVA